MDYTKSPLLDIELPPPLLIMPYLPLLGVYLGLIVADFILLRYGRHILPMPFIKGFIIVVHFFTPLVIICDALFLNILFVVAPILVVAYGLSYPVEEFNIVDWFLELVSTTYEIRKTPADLKMSKNELRFWGLFRIVKAVLKYVIIFKVIDPLLPARAIDALNFPWFSVESFFYTTLYAGKLYCFLAILDMFFGLIQLVFGIQTIESMHSPFFSSGPRDFWGRRWNMFVTYFLHTQVFARKPKAVHKKDDDKDKKTNVKDNVEVTEKTAEKTTETAEKTAEKTTETAEKTAVPPKKKAINMKNVMKSMSAFIFSGIFHEMIIMSACRRITLENLLFFIFQVGFITTEIFIRNKIGLRGEPKGIWRVISWAISVVVMIFSGRLFSAPFLRYPFFEYNAASLSAHEII